MARNGVYVQLTATTVKRIEDLLDVMVASAGTGPGDNLQSAKTAIKLILRSSHPNKGIGPKVAFDPKRIGMPPARLIEIAPDEWR